MNVLMGCEESGVGYTIFNNAGHLASSCDIKPSRVGAQHHHQCCIVEHLEGVPDGWYDLGIFHPECTAMCVAGNRHYAASQQRKDDVEWTIALWHLAKRKCRRVAFENPASVLFPHLRRLGADVQYVQPWQYGHMEQKKTGLALHNLPRLTETNNVHEEMMRLPKKERERIHYMSPGENRSRDRSESYTGIIQAMCDQWGVLKDE